MNLSEAWRLRLLYFLVFCCTASWLPILADFCKSKGVEGNEQSIILSITPLLMFLVQPLYGNLADRWGYKKCLLFSSLFAAATYLLYLKTESFWSVAVVTVLMSFFYNGIQPILDSMSLQLGKKNPAFNYGSLRVAGAIGWSVTGIITGQLIDSININMIFVVSFVSMFGVFLFALGIRKELTKEETSIEQVVYTDFRKILNNKQLILLLICVFLVSTGATAIWNFYSIYMKENGASASLVGYGLSFQGLCEIPLFYFSARIIAKLGLRISLLITILATAVRLLLYSWINTPTLAIPIELLHGISWSLFWVVGVEYVNKLVPAHWLATGQSLLYAAYYGAGAIAGNFWTGYLSDQAMKMSDIFLLNAGIVGITLLLAILFIKSPKTITAKPV